MTLRQALDDDVGRLHDLLEELFDREDAVLLMFDGHRSINYISASLRRNRAIRSKSKEEP